MRNACYTPNPDRNRQMRRVGASLGRWAVVLRWAACAHLQNPSVCAFACFRAIASVGELFDRIVERGSYSERDASRLITVYAFAHQRAGGSATSRKCSPAHTCTLRRDGRAP